MDTGENKEDWGGGIALDSGIVVYPDKPLPSLNAAGGAAYAARYRNDASQELIALICSRDLLPRIDAVHTAKMADSPSILRLRDGGVLFWPAQNGHYYTLVYDKPLGGRYWASLDGTHAGMSEDTLNHAFIMPMIKGLAEFSRLGFVHGAIRPTNLFWQGGSTTPPQIGDGLSAPCGVGQPTQFEPIERAMCVPAARGVGQHVDDCYAFGMSLAMILLGHDPFRGMDERAILRLKMEKGSFAAVIGNRRLPPAHIEILRGLLTDDPRQRWGADDLEQWIAGRRLTPKNTDAGRRASRHFSVAGKEYWQLRPLAAALAESVDEAVKLIESGSLEKWLTRSLGDDEKAKVIAEIVEELKTNGKSGHYQEQLVARVCIALDPLSPIRYRGLSVMPGGIASAMLYAVTKGQSLQILGEIIISQLVTLWVNLQKDSKTDFVPLGQQMERMKTLAEKTTFGSGLERVLYELNPAIPCLSPFFKNDCVLSPKHVLPSLERLSASSARPEEPMDRHLAAFLIVREKRGDSLFSSMNSGQDMALRRGLAMLSLFGEMQYRYGPDRLTGVCSWILPLIEPCFKRFLSRPLQEKVRRQAKEAIEKGDLALLLKRVDDPARVVGDENDFMAARAMYGDIQREIGQIESHLNNKENVARDVGRPIAASLASFFALLLIAVTLWRALWDGLMAG